MPSPPILLFLFLLLHIPLLLAIPALPDPAVFFPHSAAPATLAGDTIPAFPEQSDEYAGACPLQPRPALTPAVSSSCIADKKGGGGGGGGVSRSRCCPVLAAWLYAAYANTALAARAPAAAAAASTAVDMPEPPDDTEACAGAAERALRAGGAAVPRKNATCDAAFCVCGVRLRRFACGGGAAAGGRWQPEAKVGRRMERDCKIAAGGIAAGCSRCLRALSQLNMGNNTANSTRDCLLLGLTWLLDRNGTLYLPAATAVLHALMATDEAGGGLATGAPSCSLPLDDEELPLAVDSRQIQNNGGTRVAASSVIAVVTMLLFSTFLVSSW